MVNHKDGNGRNNHFTNLEWVTAAENTQHAYNNGLIRSLATHGTPCIYCGELTIKEDRVCAACTNVLRLENRRRESLEKRIMDRGKKLEKILEHVDLTELSDRDVKIMDKYVRGDSLQQIGTEFGISRERVRQIVGRVMQPRSSAREWVEIENQRDLSKYVQDMGFKKNKLAERTDVSYSSLNRMLNLEQGMPMEIYERLSDFTRFEGK